MDGHHYGRMFRANEVARLIREERDRRDARRDRRRARLGHAFLFLTSADYRAGRGAEPPRLP